MQLQNVIDPVLTLIDTPIVARNGTVLVTRLLRPDDVDLLLDLFAHLSPETRWRRFHAHVDNVEDSRVRQTAKELAAVDNLTLGGAVLALIPHPDEPQKEELIGVARLARDPKTPTSPDAEAAVVVRDDYQRQHIGTALLARLTELARNMGITTLVATVQSDNASMLDVLRWLNLPRKDHASHGEIEIRLDIRDLESRMANGEWQMANGE